MLCCKCRTNVPNNSRYCHVCGTPLFTDASVDDNSQNGAKSIGQKKNALLIISLVVVATVILIVLYPCILGHDWLDATCTVPKTCAKCGQTNGEALGHMWSEATCKSLSSCSSCGKTQGKLADHKWKEATCSEPKTCIVCAKTEGQATEHFWSQATEIRPQICVSCGRMMPLPRPRTGEVIEGKNKSLSSTLLLKNESGLDAYIILKDTNYKIAYSFYVRANEKKHIPIPSGEYYLYFSKGTEWFGPEYYFGKGTEPQSDFELMDFNKYWWTYTLT